MTIDFEVRPYFFGEDVIGGDPFPRCGCEYPGACSHGKEVQDWFQRQEAAWNRHLQRGRSPLVADEAEKP